MSAGKQRDDYSDEFDDSEEEDFKPRAKSSPPKRTQHKRPPQKVINLGPAGGAPKKKPAKRPVSAGTVKKAKRPAVEYWNESLRRTGVGLSTESAGNSMTGLSKKQSKEMSYSSTSHYLRQLVGTEKPKRSVLDSPGRTTPGRPAYKSPEEYYDEILDLKKQITVYQNENSTMKSKVRRLEEDNLKKEREIEQLLDPSKSDELRRTLTDRKPDGGAVIHSLKQKILKLEHQLKDREAAYARLQSDLKTTKVEEMKLQIDTFYKEIVRLNQLKSVDALPSRRQREEAVPRAENNIKMKALQETILRMNEKNLRLTTENKSLRTDLEKVLEDSAKTKDTQKDYEDMSKRQLMSAIGKLEKRLDRADADSTSILSDIDNRQSSVQGKITLEGSVAQRLDQLDHRETELLEELDKTKGMIKKLKDDRVHYRKKAEDKEKDIKSMKKEMEDLQAELDSLYDKDRSRQQTPRASTAAVRRRSPSLTGSAPRRAGRTSPQTRSRSPSVSSDTGSRREDRERNRRIEQFRQDTAAKHIQRNWRSHRQRERKGREDDETAEFLQSALRGHVNRRQQISAYKNRPPSRGASVYGDEDDSVSISDSVTESELDSAAELIQSNIRGHMSRKDLLKKSRIEDSDGDLDEAVCTVQSAFRGHLARRGLVDNERKRPYPDSDSDEVISTIQSAFRSHLARRDYLDAYRPRSRSPTLSRSSTGQGRHKLDSAGEEEDDDDKFSSVSRGSRRPSARSDSRSVAKKPPASPRKSSRAAVDISDDDSDDDDDLIVTSNRGRVF